MSDLEIRSVELEYREEAEEGFIEGIAVPYGQVANIGNQYKESFQRGAFEGSGDIKLYRDHKTLIGHVVETEDREEGLWIRAKVALTSLGKDTLALLRSGALSKFSVGFRPMAQENRNGVLVRTKALLHEVSVVERPAYVGADVLSVREENDEREPLNTNRGGMMTDDNQDIVSADDLAEVRGNIEDLSRRFDAFTPVVEKDEPKVDHRSAAEFVVALAKGDEDATRAYNETNENITSETLTRAYTGGTTADAPMQNAWVGDLTRIFDASSGVLSETFSRGTLPSKGNVLEYAQLKSTSGAIAEQAAEGDDLSFLKIQLETKTANVHTYGGYTQLSFQAIERSTLPLLQRNLEWLALQAGVNKKVELRKDFDALVAANRAVAANAGVILSGAVLASMDAAKWSAVVLEANRRFKAQGKSVEKMIVTPDVFAHLLNLTTTGDRVLRIAEGNSAGVASVGGLRATFYGITVEVDDTPTSGVSTGQAVFVHGDAIRQYDSAVVSLQDSNIINLSRDFSVYRYGAIADEMPALVVPVKLAAS